jgi:hypothetical protein
MSFDALALTAHFWPCWCTEVTSLTNSGNDSNSDLIRCSHSRNIRDPGSSTRPSQPLRRVLHDFGDSGAASGVGFSASSNSLVVFWLMLLSRSKAIVPQSRDLAAVMSRKPSVSYRVRSVTAFRAVTGSVGSDTAVAAGLMTIGVNAGRNRILLASAVRRHDHLAHVLMEALGRLGESRLRARPICCLLSPACPRYQNNESPLRLASCSKVAAHYRRRFLR